MLGNWILLLLLLPGWLVPSGLHVPLCTCRMPLSAERSCCAPAEQPVEVSSCCARAEAADEHGSRIERERTCECSIAVPVHRGGHAITIAAHFAWTVPPPALLTQSIARSVETTALRVEPNRPRGPSPGRPNPLPLRL